MPTIRLTPSTYSVSSTTYLSVSNVNNMYTDTDSETYATVTNSQTGTTSYYLYIRGFDFSQLPDNAVVTDWSVKLKARESGISTSTSYSPKLCNNTSQITSTTSSISTTATTHEFTDVGVEWEDIVDYGSNFGIRINCRRASRNTTGYVYVYGAEIEVTYYIPVYHNVTLTNTTTANAAVNDTNPLEGTDVTVTTDTLTGIAVTDNGIDVTSSFTYGASSSISQTPESDVDTSFTDSGGEFYISSTSVTTQYLEYACGHSAEDPGTETTTNTYVKGSASDNTTTGDCIYSFDFSGIPAGATITSVSVRAYVARENSTIDSTHVCRVSVYSGSSIKGDVDEVSGTSYHIHTLSNTGTWTRSELQQAKFHLTLGYYGGRIAGISWDVSYEVDGYSYVISNVTSDHAIVFAYVSSGPKLYVKQSSFWVEVTKAYVKSNGAWTRVSLDQAFDASKKYVAG